MFRNKKIHQPFVDIHCHCLPGLDDGPVDLQASLSLCNALVADGIDTIIAAPHQLGRFDGKYSVSVIRASVEALNSEIKSAGLNLQVFAGAEVRVDERIPFLLQEDRVLSLGDSGGFLLLELIPDVMIDLSFLIKELTGLGIETIIAHPERCEYLAQRMKTVEKWMDSGATLQLTAASLFGQEGASANKIGWDFIERGWVSYIATDAHSLEIRRPMMRAAFEAIKERKGAGLAEQLCITNPTKIIAQAKAAKKHKISSKV